MSAITLVAAGDHADGGSVAVDVSAYSTLRLTLNVTAARVDRNPPTLAIAFDVSANAADWHEIAAIEAHEIGAQRFVLDGLDTWLRVRWTAHDKTIGVDHGFRWSLAGDAI